MGEFGSVVGNRRLSGVCTANPRAAGNLAHSDDALGRFRPLATPSGNGRYLRISFSNGSYVDGPLASVFISAVNGWRPSVICPACWRGLGPLALMKSDDPRLPIKGASLGLLTHCGVSDGLRSSRRVVHHVVVALAKLLSLRSPFECVAPDWDQALA